jgi:hypothetical protein
MVANKLLGYNCEVCPNGCCVRLEIGGLAAAENALLVEVLDGFVRKIVLPYLGYEIECEREPTDADALRFKIQQGRI